MVQKITDRKAASTGCFEELESFARLEIQGWMQRVLEEVVTSFLGRAKSERRAQVDEPPVYRNGHGKARRLSMMGGTIEVCRPRVHGLDERFEAGCCRCFSVARRRWRRSCL